LAKVLFIDDERGVRDVFVKLLQYQGHDAHPASDGEGALEILSDDSFDVVVTDQMLPGIQGLDLAGRVRELRLRAAVIVLSGRLTQEIVDEAARLQVSECIAKPVTGEQVGEAVERALRRRM
jgi:DNA-binding NtrC family response regulator